MKKDTGKWCGLHNILTHNRNECHAKHSLVVDMKFLESNSCSNFELEPDKGKQIIDIEPYATISTTKVKKKEFEDSEEGECLFLS